MLFHKKRKCLKKEVVNRHLDVLCVSKVQD